MGKKSRRPARQQKKPTLEDLDDDTAKPTAPPTVAQLYKSHFYANHENLKDDPETNDKLIAAFEALTEKEQKIYAMLAKEKRTLFERRVAFCAKSGPDLVGEMFLEAAPLVTLGSLKLEGVDVRVVGLNQSVWEASH